MADFVRVKDKETGHEFSLAARSVNADLHDVLDKPAVDANGRPLPAKPHINLPKAAVAEGPVPSTPAVKATKQKESS